jgi:hypothetical protein
MIGAILASTVFVPIGWSIIQGERQRAEEAHEAIQQTAALAQTYKTGLDSTNASLLRLAEDVGKSPEEWLKEMTGKPGLSEEQKQWLMQMYGLRKLQEEVRRKLP